MNKGWELVEGLPTRAQAAGVDIRVPGFWNLEGSHDRFRRVGLWVVGCELWVVIRRIRSRNA